MKMSLSTVPLSMLMALGAALSFTTGGVFMQMSNGLSNPLPTVFLYALFLLGASLQTLAMKEAEMGITYVLVIGIEAILAISFSILFFKEGYSFIKLLGVFLVTVGVILMRSGDV